MKQALGVTNEVDDIVLFTFVRRTDDADRLVEYDVDWLDFGLDDPTIDTHVIPWKYAITRPRGHPIDGHTTSSDKPVRFTPRTQTCVSDEFIETYGFFFCHRSAKVAVTCQFYALLIVSCFQYFFSIVKYPFELPPDEQLFGDGTDEAHRRLIGDDVCHQYATIF